LGPLEELDAFLEIFDGLLEAFDIGLDVAVEQV
jgi:hypothetical protein